VPFKSKAKRSAWSLNHRRTHEHARFAHNEVNARWRAQHPDYHRNRAEKKVRDKNDWIKSSFRVTVLPENYFIFASCYARRASDLSIMKATGWSKTLVSFWRGKTKRKANGRNLTAIQKSRRRRWDIAREKNFFPDKTALAQSFRACKGLCVCGKRLRIQDRFTSMDHDHVTGKFRRWLCHHCNVILGMSKENKALLLLLAELCA
jgi:hypothetical protein